MKIWFINTTEEKIEEKEISGFEDIQKLIGGYFERAWTLRNGDEVFVNDNGLNEENPLFFTVMGSPHAAYAGNGVVLGKVDEEGEHLPVTSKLWELKIQIKFVGNKVPLCTTCLMCKEEKVVFVSKEDLKKWQGGMTIQEAMPYLSKEDRELLISRSCADCFEKLFGKNAK